MSEHLIYCAGQFTETDNQIEVRNPYDGSVVSKTYLADDHLLELAIAGAVNVAPHMAELPA